MYDMTYALFIAVLAPVLILIVGYITIFICKGIDCLRHRLRERAEAKQKRGRRQRRVG